jgi:hypothetical protein
LVQLVLKWRTFKTILWVYTGISLD